MTRFDPREWTLERMTFSGYKLLGHLLIVSGRAAQKSGYDEAVLVRKPGRNSFEVYSLAGLFSALYGAVAIALLHRLGASGTALIAIAPLLPFATLAIVLAVILLSGFIVLLAERLGLRAERLRADGFVHLIIATSCAALLALDGYWTRWVGVAWFVLFAVNISCSVLILLLRPYFRRVSAAAWRDTQFVD